MSVVIDKPLILNLETATEVCSVCLSRGEEVLALRETDKLSDHAKLITLLIQQCFSEANLNLKNLDAVAVSAGPGSYTSLRVGVSTAKGICYALNKPLLEIDTLKALAFGTYQKEKQAAYYCPMIDARRMEVYCALFDTNNNMVESGAAKIVDMSAWEEYFSAGKTIVFSGSGSEKCKVVLTSPLAIFSPVRCSSAHLVSFSSRAFSQCNFADLALFSPHYLKHPNITTSTKNKMWTEQ
ncbi:MAG: tRNA (adenosine(37)-N6)-threonylcarbamoyltransferase complex dimerization subunit type 1 TsaB [Bacteroidota bacterium]